jgi:microcin C transport system substrate-binding protein
MRLTAALFSAVMLLSAPAGAEVRTVHALAMHGDTKYPADFKHFDYVNPDAPKGGTLRLHAIGAFDTLNPYIIKGQPPGIIGLMYETLLNSSADEAFTEYGHIAESITVPDDRSWVEFTLRPQARWHDGQAITPDDVVYSFNMLREKGAPRYRLYYATVDAVAKTGPRSVKFTFKPGDNRELPLILGQLPVLPKHYWEKRKFDETTLEVPLGSGPYKVSGFEPGRFIVLERVKDWWAKDLPVSKGFYNFDTIRVDYFRDSTVALEAFKAGQYDFREENESKKWATAYDFPAIQSGQVKKEKLPNQNPTGMQAYAFNLRRPLFQDPRVRHALAFAFDFEWANQNLFYGQYERTESYFSNSELAAKGLPSPEELAILKPLADQIPPEVFTTEYRAPKTDGTGNIRPNLRLAMDLLKQAGWEVKNGRLVNAEGKPFEFEILLVQPAFERITGPFVGNLERLGIKATIRTVDTAQYENRERAFDFDMVVDSWGESLSPGNEQREFWGSDAAIEPGSRNTLGIRNPAIDKLVDLVISAPDRDSLVTRTHALDRVLLWNHYVIPHWHIGYDRVAYWDKFGRPAVIPERGFQLFAWWIDAKKPLASAAAPSPQPQ